MTVSDGVGEDVGLAAEYALGVLDAGERRLAETRLAADAGFRAEVQAWQDALHPLSDSIPAASPPADLWPRIDASLAGADPRPLDRPARAAAGGGWWSSLSFWRGATAGMGALAAAAVAFAVLPTNRPAGPTPIDAQPQMIVARLASDREPAAFIVAYDPMRKSTLVTPLTQEQVDRVHELWVIPEGGTPQSLGVIRMDQPGRYAVPEALQRLVVGEGALAVSLEPEGGSPTGSPTGPVVAQGPLNRV